MRRVSTWANPYLRACTVSSRVSTWLPMGLTCHRDSKSEAQANGRYYLVWIQNTEVPGVQVPEESGFSISSVAVVGPARRLWGR